MNPANAAEAFPACGDSDKEGRESTTWSAANLPSKRRCAKLDRAFAAEEQGSNLIVEGAHSHVAAPCRRTYFSAEARDVWTGIHLAALAAMWRNESEDSRTLRLEQRRGRRVRAGMPVLLYGRLADEPFQEETQTIDVSSHGGLFPISAPVVPSQKLVLTNLETNDDLACRVARLIRTEQGTTLAAVEFLQPSLRFWGSAVSSFGHENSTAERIS